MKKTIIYTILFFMAVILSASQVSMAQFSLFQGKGKVEAIEGKEYLLSDSDGLWFIMAKTFIGEDARERANQLAFELRKKYKMESYVYRSNPDTDDLAELSSQRGHTRKYRYQTEPQEQYAVLVGSFPSSEDLNLQKTLLTVKRSKPDCLAKDSLSRMITARYEEMAKKSSEFAGFGPLGGAIAVPNPLIDKEYFNQKGVVDTFIEKINSDSRYNLLNNPKMYTIRVATFAGASTTYKMGQPGRELKSKLQEAGIKASALCTALRKKGVDAWEFHDRDSSFVTIGGFDNYGYSRADGRTEIDPAIYQLMEKYRGKMTGQGGAYSAYTVTVELSDGGPLGKKTRVEIPFDLQPVIIMVPQRPDNIKRTLAAKKKLDEELNHYEKQYERQVISQSLEADAAYDSRNYGANLSEGRELTQEEYEAIVARERQGLAGFPPPVTQQNQNPSAQIVNNQPVAAGYPVATQPPQAYQPQTATYPQSQGYLPQSVPAAGQTLPVEQTATRPNVAPTY
ncbi:MAG: hypothetical protein Q4G68_02655 [Planctomycetia bacterium]|nr:hypothetical protein [Planctomycetia bacterium]